MVHLRNRSTGNSVDIKMYFQHVLDWPAYFNPNVTSCTVTLDAIH